VRFGGEEFLVFLSGSGVSDAVDWANVLRAELEAQILRSGGNAYRVTASFGVATFSPGHGHWSELIRLADSALYRAKSEGRNQVRMAMPTARCIA